MENNFNDQFTNDIAAPPARPQFLKVLCILSFIACGIWILIYFLGSFSLALSEEKIATFWDQVLERQPQLESVNPGEFFHEIGIVCILSLLANIVSLVGVIMMWKLNKVGFFIYIAAEFATYFVGMGMSANANGSGSSFSTIAMIVIDIVFIAMYAVNLKHMKKTAVQS